MFLALDMAFELAKELLDVGHRDDSGWQVRGKECVKTR